MAVSPDVRCPQLVPELNVGICGIRMLGLGGVWNIRQNSHPEIYQMPNIGQNGHPAIYQKVITLYNSTC